MHFILILTFYNSPSPRLPATTAVRRYEKFVESFSSPIKLVTNKSPLTSSELTAKRGYCLVGLLDPLTGPSSSLASTSFVSPPSPSFGSLPFTSTLVEALDRIRVDGLGDMEALDSIGVGSAGVDGVAGVETLVGVGMGGLAVDGVNGVKCHL